MEFGQLHHIEYYVKDLKRSIDFWGWFLSEMGIRNIKHGKVVSAIDILVELILFSFKWHQKP
jgi:catechol 2,3-dioxygenase-like lactoylglutathione lyase family enzyme